MIIGTSQQQPMRERKQFLRDIYLVHLASQPQHRVLRRLYMTLLSVLGLCDGLRVDRSFREQSLVDRAPCTFLWEGTVDKVLLDRNEGTRRYSCDGAMLQNSQPS
jgi:hypothetical protein